MKKINGSTRNKCLNECGGAYIFNAKYFHTHDTPAGCIAAIYYRGILLQDTAKIHNMLMGTARTRICPKTPQIRCSLPRHTARIILIIS